MDVDEELDQPDDSGMDVDEDEWDQLMRMYGCRWR